MSKKKNKKSKGVKIMEEKIITEEPVVEVAEEVTEEPVVEAVEEPVVEVAEEGTEEPVVEVAEEVTEEPVVEAVEEGVVIPTLLNVRNLPNKESEIIRVLNKDDEVKIIGTENDFFIVELDDGLIGYCVKDFIAKNN